MTIDADELSRLRKMAAEGLDQDDGISGAFKAGQWAEAHREELCRAVLQLAVEVEEQAAEIDEQEWIIEQFMFAGISEQVQEEVWV